MMKKYMNPEIAFLLPATGDVITASLNEQDAGFGRNDVDFNDFIGG